VDYPDFAAAVASKVASSECERGILVCSSGVGMSIAANKVHGIRAALGVSADEVRLTRAHNDANVLALGATFTDEATAMSLVETFLDTGFDGGRHERRLRKIEQIENQQK
jgi:RpiB/LacA/LacB family sugar-phosphate isomerase